jgi:hypothetical protein
MKIYYKKRHNVSRPCVILSSWKADINSEKNETMTAQHCVIFCTSSPTLSQKKITLRRPKSEKNFITSADLSSENYRQYFSRHKVRHSVCRSYVKKITDALSSDANSWSPKMIRSMYSNAICNKNWSCSCYLCNTFF